MEIVDSVVVVLIPGATLWKAHVPHLHEIESEVRAIDEDWSALRFRKAEYIKSLTRQPSRASSSAGKKRTSAK